MVIPLAKFDFNMLTFVIQKTWKHHIMAWPSFTNFIRPAACSASLLSNNNNLNCFEFQRDDNRHAKGYQNALDYLLKTSPLINHVSLTIHPIVDGYSLPRDQDNVSHTAAHCQRSRISLKGFLACNSYRKIRTMKF